MIEGAPRTLDYLCEPCAEHFRLLRGYLEAMDLPYVLTSRLVRGLDYYTRTVFEVVPPTEGAQATIGGGGRYDGLAEQIGGKPTPGVGFAAGLDRIILNMRQQGCPLPPEERPDVFFAPIGTDAKRQAAVFAGEARRRGIAAVVGTGDRSMRARLRQASASGAPTTVILGEDEMQAREATLKDLESGDQQHVPFGELVARLAASRDGVKP